MKPAVFILALPMVIYAWLLFATQDSDVFSSAFHMALLSLWFLSSIICLVWGFYISRRSRRLGWLCVAVAMIPLVMLVMPVYRS